MNRILVVTSEGVGSVDFPIDRFLIFDCRRGLNHPDIRLSLGEAVQEEQSRVVVLLTRSSHGITREMDVTAWGLLDDHAEIGAVLLVSTDYKRATRDHTHITIVQISRGNGLITPSVSNPMRISDFLETVTVYADMALRDLSPIKEAA